MKKLFATLSVVACMSLAQSPEAAAQEVPNSVTQEVPSTSWFLTQGTRVITTFGQADIGMANEFGARFGRFMVGLSTLYRPASWSSHRFEHQLDSGMTYKGQSSVELGSQYGFVGLFVAPTLPVPGTDRMALDLPATVGMGFLGTPLMGDDRTTPDGRRVSDWENELTNGGDITFGLAVDVGVRLRVRPLDIPWFHVAAGMHYTVFPGYESNVVDKAIRGASGSFSVVLGPMQ